MKPSFKFQFAATLLLAAIPIVQAPGQEIRPVPCPAEQASVFDFLVGDWRGVVFDLHGSDSVAAGPIATISTKKVLTGCALLESWHFEQKGQTEVDALVLRAFDVASGRWSYAIATSRNEHVHYDGQLKNSVWTFFYDFGGDKPARVGITWVPTANGYSEQVARSTDGGRTWTSTRHVNFTRAGSRLP
jgi:hypothetical protein